MTFEFLAALEPDGRRVSAGPRALTSRARLGPPLPASALPVIPWFSSSRAQPTEAAPQYPAALPGRYQGAQEGSPQHPQHSLTAAARKVAAALRIPPTPCSPAGSAPSCGREEVSHMPQRGVFLSCLEVGLGAQR